MSLLKKWVLHLKNRNDQNLPKIKRKTSRNLLPQPKPKSKNHHKDKRNRVHRLPTQALKRLLTMLPRLD